MFVLVGNEANELISVAKMANVSLFVGKIGALVPGAGHLITERLAIQVISVKQTKIVEIIGDGINAKLFPVVVHYLPPIGWKMFGDVTRQVNG